MSVPAPGVGTAPLRYNLFLVSNPKINERADFELLARLVGELAPDIQVFVADDHRVDWRRSMGNFDLPTMTFSPGPLARFRPPRGRVFQGMPLTKQQECAALERAGVPIPRWAVVTPDTTPDLSEFGPYVVVKPDRSGRGADVKIQRKGRVRWRPPRTAFTRQLSGEHAPWVVQEFVYTGPWPVSHRVATLFGEPLWAWRVEASHERRRLKHREDFRDGSTGGGMSIVSSGRGCVFSLCEDPAVLALARCAHAAFPDIPLLGVDLLQDAQTRQWFVIEVNAIGYTWHLTSPIGRAIQCEFGFDLASQFDARGTAARILAAQVHRHAR